MNSKKTIIIALILIIIVGVVGFFVYDEVQSKNRIAVANKNYDVAMVNQLKASINLYYALKSEYPRSSKDLVEELKKDNNVTVETLQQSIKDLKDFNYNVRGDGQAYKFTYIDTEGNKQTVEGNYKEDFHNDE